MRSDRVTLRGLLLSRGESDWEQGDLQLSCLWGLMGSRTGCQLGRCLKPPCPEESDGAGFWPESPLVRECGQDPLAIAPRPLLTMSVHSALAPLNRL